MFKYGFTCDYYIYCCWKIVKVTSRNKINEDIDENRENLGENNTSTQIIELVLNASMSFSLVQCDRHVSQHAYESSM